MMHTDGMLNNQTVKADMPLLKLAIPIFFENLLRVALSSIDVFMLSRFSEDAVAAVTISGYFVFLLMLLYQIVTIGTSTVISQHLGAERYELAGKTALASYVATMGFAVVLSAVMSINAAGILRLLYDLEPMVQKYASAYLTVYTGGSLFLGLNIVQAVIMRSYGYAFQSMRANMIANVCNVFGNWLALYGPFGLPVTGVAGVAVSTVASQAIACIILGIEISRKPDIHIPWKQIRQVPGKVYRQILSIGLPSAGEGLSYNISQITISSIIAGLGTAALVSHGYATTFMRYVLMPTLSIGYAAQIKIGYLVGARRFAEAKAKMYRYAGSGYLFSASLVVLVYLLRRPLLSIFTDNPEIIRICSQLLLICILRETGRVANITVIPGLKGSGDVMFPVVNGIIFQWLVGVGGAFFFVYVMHWGLAGIWLAIALDEWVRTFIMLGRWQSNAWQAKRLNDT
ncbi:MAG: MATE family efflux transporter [Spirochaetales bacterium]|nr:MATE family efflux transporter [Spirochaetales bacterium]